MSRLDLLHIPVYAESHEQFCKRREREIESKIARADEAWQRCGHARAPERKHREIREEVEEASGMWRFTRVVGWFLVTIQNGELEVHLYQNSAERFTSKSTVRHRLVSYREHSLGSLHPSAQDVPTWLVEALRESQRTYFRRRWMDWAAISALVGTLDWHLLMNPRPTKRK